jgi:hypothetical protein
MCYHKLGLNEDAKAAALKALEFTDLSDDDRNRINKNIEYFE